MAGNRYVLLHTVLLFFPAWRLAIVRYVKTALSFFVGLLIHFLSTSLIFLFGWGNGLSHSNKLTHAHSLAPRPPQAAEAGVKLRSLLRPDDTLHFFTSPYRRTRETTEGILNTLTADTPDPSPFPRKTIKVYEEPRLREQDFGNFQPGSAEMACMWQERANYGHFFYRIPNGESAADAYDRISGFNESLWRSFGEEDFASVCVLVTHGLMTRVFLMKWYHFSVEYFEDLRNVNHCEFVIMKLNPDNGKFILQNQLRTWSQLQREQAEALMPPMSPIPVRKRWGDWQESCDAGGFERRQLERRQNTTDLVGLDEATAISIEYAKGIQSSSTKRLSSLATQGHDHRQRGTKPVSAPTEEPQTDAAEVPVTFSATGPRKRILSPTTQAILNAGRDGGGSQSGAASEDDEADDSSSLKFGMNTTLQGGIRGGTGLDGSGSGSGSGSGNGSGSGSESREIMTEEEEGGEGGEGIEDIRTDGTGILNRARADALGDQK
jgi:broad specificity phosphatase PhoE